MRLLPLEHLLTIKARRKRGGMHLKPTSSVLAATMPAQLQALLQAMALPASFNILKLSHTARSIPAKTPNSPQVPNTVLLSLMLPPPRPLPRPNTATKILTLLATLEPQDLRQASPVSTSRWPA